MYSGRCLQQSGVADPFEPERATFLYVKEAVVQRSKQRAEGTRHVACRLHAELTRASRGAMRTEGHLRLGPGPPSSRLCPLIAEGARRSA